MRCLVYRLKLGAILLFSMQICLVIGISGVSAANLEVGNGSEETAQGEVIEDPYWYGVVDSISKDFITINDQGCSLDGSTKYLTAGGSLTYWGNFHEGDPVKFLVDKDLMENEQVLVVVELQADKSRAVPEASGSQKSSTGGSEVKLVDGVWTN